MTKSLEDLSSQAEQNKSIFHDLYRSLFVWYNLDHSTLLCGLNPSSLVSIFHLSVVILCIVDINDFSQYEKICNFLFATPPR
jgi:hypothetical protein